MTRDETIARIRTALRSRSGQTWSVRGGRGTAWGWITVTAPPARLTGCGGMSDDDRDALSDLFGETVHHQGISIPAQRDYYAEYVARAEGRDPETVGVPAWD